MSINSSNVGNTWTPLAVRLYSTRGGDFTEYFLFHNT